jgi:hypothetical protein
MLIENGGPSLQTLAPVTWYKYLALIYTWAQPAHKGVLLSSKEYMAGNRVGSWACASFLS